MLAIHYRHRLPADHDLARIRRRAAERGPLWDATPGLAFKAFMLRERGRHGATGHEYGSIYLWHDARAAVDMLTDERFGAVIDGFGRPAVETWLPLAAKAGRAAEARTLYRELLPLAAGDDPAALRVAEARHVAREADRADVVAVASLLDPAGWRVLRITLSAAEADPSRAGEIDEVLHLSRPGLDALR